MKKPCGFCYDISADKLGKADYNDAKHLITAKQYTSPKANITKKDLVISDKVFFSGDPDENRPSASHTYSSATQILRISVLASLLFAEIDSPNQFLYAKTLSSSILQDIKK